MKDDYPIYVKWRYITEYLLDICGKFPKNARFNLADRITNISLDVMERIIETIYAGEKKRILEKANLQMEKIRALLQIVLNKKYISTGQYGYISEEINGGGQNAQRLDKIMQRVGNLKDIFLSFENLYSAYKKACRGTKSYQAYAFAFNADREILRLKRELSGGTYEPGDYRYFTIKEPKERVISVAPFRDRVVHHALINVLEPIYEKRFI